MWVEVHLGVSQDRGKLLHTVRSAPAGVNTVWLEAQTGVRYETMKRHYGK